MRTTGMRSRVGVTVVAAISAFALVACAGSEDAAPGAGQGDGASGGALSGKVSLLTPIFEGSDGQRLLEDELLPKFYAEHPEVEVSVDYTTYGQLNEKLTTGVASGLIPDVMMMGVGWIEGFADRGVLANLSERGLSQEKLAESYTSEIIEAGVWEDNVYALPIMLDTRFGVARMDLLNEAGYDAPPKDWDELREMAKALTVRSADGTLERSGFDIMSLDPRQAFLTMLFSADGSLFTEDLSTPAFNSPEGVAALEFMTDLIHVDKVEDLGFSAANADVNPLVNGRAAMAIAHNNVWDAVEAAAPELVDQLQPFVIQGEASGMFFGGTFATVSAKSKNPEAAQALMEFLASPEAALAANEQRGNVPALTELLDSDYVESRPLVQFAMENLSSAQREGGPAAWLEIRGDFKPAIEEALLEQKTPKEALDDLAAKAQTAMDR